MIGEEEISASVGFIVIFYDVLSNYAVGRWTRIVLFSIYRPISNNFSSNPKMQPAHAVKFSARGNE